MITNRVNNKPETFTREELVNMIKAEVLQSVLNEIIALDDGDIREGRGDAILKEAKNRIFNILNEVINDVKEIEDIDKLLIESMASTMLYVTAGERVMNNEMDL